MIVKFFTAIFGFLLLWGFWNADTASIIYLILIAIIEGIVISASMGSGRPRPELNLTEKEEEYFKKYHFYFKTPITAQQLSATLSVICPLTYVWVPLLLYKGLWFQAALIGANLFLANRFAKLSSPRIYLHSKVEDDKDKSFLEAMNTVDSICKKIDEYNQRMFSAASEHERMPIRGEATTREQSEKSSDKVIVTVIEEKKKSSWPRRILVGSALMTLIFLVLYSFGNRMTSSNTNEWLAKGDKYTAARQFHDAINAYTNAIDAEPKNSEAYFRRGFVYQCISDHRKAIEDLSKAIDFNPKDPMYFCARADCYAKLNDSERALDDANKALSLNSKFGGAYLVRGQIHNQMKNYRQTIEDIDTAITLDPKTGNEETYVLRGMSYIMVENYILALRDLNKAIEMNPKYADAYMYRGIIIGGANGQYREGIEDIDKAIQLNPRLCKAYVARGNLYMQLGQHDQAIKDCSKAIELDPNMGMAYETLGKAYYSNGEYQKADESMKNAARLGVQASQSTQSGKVNP